jgi:hypothetical protein
MKSVQGSVNITDWPTQRFSLGPAAYFLPGLTERLGSKQLLVGAMFVLEACDQPTREMANSQCLMRARLPGFSGTACPAFAFKSFGVQTRTSEGVRTKPAHFGP